jgi:hypothetical protein
VLINSVQLGETTKKVELRIVREGNEFTAGYRKSSRSWQDIGSTELNLGANVDVGIIQVTQYSSKEISADFDYFRVYTK